MPRKPNTTGIRYDEPFPRILRELMKERKVTQDTLAEVLGLKNRQSVTGYIDGSTVPSIDKLVSLANFFDVSADYFLGLSAPKTRDDDVKFICSYTGLSEEALNVIKQLSPKSLEALNRVLCFDSFESVLLALNLCEFYSLNINEFPEFISPYNFINEDNIDYVIERKEALEELLSMLRLNAFNFQEACLDMLYDLSGYKKAKKEAEKVIIALDKEIDAFLYPDN